MQIVRIPSSLEPLDQGVWIGRLVIFSNVQSSKESVYAIAFTHMQMLRQLFVRET